MAFPLNVVRRRGVEALMKRPKVMVGTIHCSPPDEMIMTKRGQVPISELQPSDRLVGYHLGTNSILGNGGHKNSKGYEFERSERHYSGRLITIATNRSRTRVTPNHRVVARFDEGAFCGRWAVYMMRRGNWWRVGICTTAHRPYRPGGVNGRLATEQADAGWILSVHETREAAIAAEAVIQARFGIPGLTFEAARNRTLSSAALHQIHEETAPFVSLRAGQALIELGLGPDWPLYQRGVVEEKAKRNMSGWFVTEAANLMPLSGRVEMATYNGTRKAAPLRATVVTEDYDGPVYGLDVPPYHYYISGGAVVHNSVKGGEADVCYLSPDLSRAGFNQWAPRGPSRNPIIRQFYVGMTRARETLVLCQPGSPWSVQWGPALKAG
jgi:DNA helicase-2/ATP-dependent DNA helicase PcrA